jgi:hypothetical protein
MTAASARKTVHYRDALCIYKMMGHALGKELVRELGGNVKDGALLVLRETHPLDLVHERLVQAASEEAEDVAGPLQLPGRGKAEGGEAVLRREQRALLDCRVACV